MYGALAYMELVPFYGMPLHCAGMLFGLKLLMLFRQSVQIFLKIVLNSFDFLMHI